MPVKIKDKRKCCGCAACSNVCPKNCISMRMDDEGFYYPVVDEENCIHCDLCKKVCPVLNNPNDEVEVNPVFFAARSLDHGVRQNSSSGGIAYLLSKSFISEGNAVCGVRMSPDLSHAEYVSVEDNENLSFLNGSKYLQSVPGDIFSRMQKLLSDEKKVLFIGTPCQVAGIKNYFKNDSENIFYIDIVCHGVPSQLLWDKWSEYLVDENKSAVKSVNFRDKRNGWQEYGFSANLENGKSLYFERKRGFLGLYLKNLCLRPSCGSCQHKGFNRCSDLTIADFWGIEKVLPDYEKKNGVSLVMVNTQRGEKMLHSIREELEIDEVDCKELFQSRNKTMLKSVTINGDRSRFMKDLKKKNIPQLEKKYLNRSFCSRLKRKLKRIVQK